MMPATGDRGPAPDFEVVAPRNRAVEFEPGGENVDRFLRLAELLEQAVGHPIDLVTTEGLSPFIGPHVLAEATDVLRAA